MEYFETGKALGIEKRTLPAKTYNLMRLLFHRTDGDCIFVPIRSMQYQAIIDEKEVSFVYIHRRTQIEFVWRNFKPQQRESINDSVSYDFVYYKSRALETMKRAQVEFHKFSRQLYERKINSIDDSSGNGRKITPFRPPDSSV